MELQEGMCLMKANEIEILYEDNHLLVVYKPANLLSQGDSTKDLDLLSLLKEYLKEKYHKKGNAYVGMVQRLDRPVSGVMVYAKTSKAASRLSEQIRLHQMNKQYLAVIHGILKEKNGEWRDYLEKLETGKTVISTKEKGKEAILKYEVIEEKDNYSLVKIDLKTGRHHQIRVQFASRNHPLYGDGRYGTLENETIALCCYQLSFFHPITKEKLTFTHPPKEKGIWKNFHDSLEKTDKKQPIPKHTKLQ